LTSTVLNLHWEAAMRRLVVLAASLAPLLAFAADDASAQNRGLPPYRGGGVGAGAAPASPALASPGIGGPRAGVYRGGAGWGYSPDRGYRGAYYGRRGYYGGRGWGAGALAAGTVLGAAAAYPYYYGRPYDYDYVTPYYYGGPYYAEPYYVAPVSSGIGEYCRTPVRICKLIDPADLGVGCSCRVAGGRAYGSVVP
jgi:hypothetical protein